MSYLRKRAVQIIPVVFIISVINYVLVYLAGEPTSFFLPDDATQEDIERVRKALGLDKPFYVQFFTYFSNVLQADFGLSYRYKEPALNLVLERLPATLELAGAALFIAVMISVPLGILAATKRNSYLDLFLSGLTVLTKAMPNFWLGIMFILFFGVMLQWLPISGRGSPMQIILPALTLGTGIAAEMTRLIRSQMIEILNQDYIRTAKSKGLINRTILFRHAFKNALVPIITIITLQLSVLISGALVTEMVFSWPGLGQLLVHSVNQRDMAIVQAAVFIVSLIVIVLNLVVDLLYQLVDPRITLK